MWDTAFAQFPPVLKKEEEQGQGLQQELRQISIIVHTGWGIRINDEYSTLNFGASPLDVARIPKEKCSPADIYKRIAPSLHDGPGDDRDGEIVYVNLYFKGKEKSTLKNMKRSEADLLFEDLLEIAIPYEPARFKKLLETHPIKRHPEIDASPEMDVGVEAPPVLGTRDERPKEITPPQPPSAIESPEPESLPGERPKQTTRQAADGTTKVAHSDWLSFWPWFAGIAAVAAVVMLVVRKLKPEH